MNDLITQGQRAIESINQALSGPMEEQIVVIQWLQSQLENRSNDLRKKLLETMGDGYELAAFDTHIVSKVKLPMKWEYPSPLHAKIVADIEERKKQLKEMEREMQKNGMAVPQSEQEYTKRIRELKLTKEAK